MDSQKTGALIRACRKEKDLTQLDLAMQIGVTQKAISKWETGRGMPDAGIWESLCNALDITPTELVIGERITDEAILKEKADEVVSTVVWENYRKRQFTKKILIIAVIVAIIIAAMAAVIAEIGPNALADMLYGYYGITSGIAMSPTLCMGIVVIIGALAALFLKVLNIRVADPNSADPVTEDGIVLEKFIDCSAFHMDAMPTVVVRLYGDKKKKLYTGYWKTYDALNPGDKIRVTYRAGKMTDHEVIEEGPYTKEFKKPHEAKAVFERRFLEKITGQKRIPVGEFTLLENEEDLQAAADNQKSRNQQNSSKPRKIDLRLDSCYVNLENGQTGTMIWHGNVLDDWKGA